MEVRDDEIPLQRPLDQQDVGADGVTEYGFRDTASGVPQDGAPQRARTFAQTNVVDVKTSFAQRGVEVIEGHVPVVVDV